MTERSHSGVARTNAANGAHCVTVHDARPVSPGGLAASDRIYRDRKGEIYLMHHSPKQRWYYVPEMRSDEALRIELRTIAFHAA